MRSHENFITTKSVISLISGLYIATSLAVLSSVFFLLTSLDRAAKLDRAKRVDIAMKLETRYLVGILVEYSWWDEAYEKIFVDQDKSWIENNSGQYLINEHGFDFSLAIKADRQLASLSINDDVKGLEFEQLMAGGLEDLVEAAVHSESDKSAVTGYVLAGEDIYLVALSSFRKEKTAEVRPGSYLSLGKRLDADYIAELESVYELPGLHLVNKAEETANYKVLLDASDQTVGRLAWSLEQPSLLIAPKVVVIVIPFFCLAMFLTQYFLKRDHANRLAFEEQLYEEATLDALTNISNRRHFMALGEKEMAFQRRMGGMLIVALFDIDHFKFINDTYGHATGDEALVHMAQICSSELRESDIFGRLGGDEFAIILRETPIEEAVEVVNRVRKKIETCPMRVGTNVIAITVSIGVASMNDSTAFNSLLKLADVALYKAKKSGRNQVCVEM